MNTLVKQEHDKFTNITTTTTAQIIDGGCCEINFRCINSAGVRSVLMDVTYHASAPSNQFFLSEGKMIIRLNDMRNETLIPHESWCRWITHELIESDWYEISPSLLQDIAEASLVEIQISGRDSSFIFTPHETSYSPQTIAQAMYDCIYNSSKYESRINDLVNIRKNNRAWAIIVAIAWLGGIPFLTATGGVWGIIIGSWEPFKCLLAISFVLAILSMIIFFYHHSKLKK